METKSIQFNNRQLNYRLTGKGTAVMLVHGFGEEGSIWKNQYDLFPANTLIIPDLPGSGESAMQDDMSMAGMADALDAILEKENIVSCIMIGHSMGGYITLAFAEKFPDKLLGFGLFHSSAFADNETKIETRKKGIEFIKSNGAAAFLKTTIPNLYSSFTKDKHPELIEQHLSVINNFSPEALTGYYNAMIERPDRTKVLKETNLPVLFILGREDQAVPIEDGLKQCHLPKISKVEILEYSGHMGMVEETDKANIALLEYTQLVSYRGNF
jgi:pimeloyl-ACP methyl ester carboxylesterase